MNGPQFLAFYAVLSLLVIFACRWFIRGSDATERLPVPAIPAEPDPFELAYLKEGDEGAFDVALFRLRSSDAVLTVRRRTQTLWQRTDRAREGALHPLESALLDALDEPRSRAVLLSRWRARANATLTQHAQRLEKEQLLRSAGERARARAIIAVGLASLLLVGIDRIAWAISVSHRNIAYLILEMIAVAIVLPVVCWSDRFTTRGRRYVERIRLAFLPVRGASAAPALMPLAVGLFGASALAGTAYAQDAQGFSRRVLVGSGSDGGEGGGSCGGGGGGCGGGCGG